MASITKADPRLTRAVLSSARHKCSCGVGLPTRSCSKRLCKDCCVQKHKGNCDAPAQTFEIDAEMEKQMMEALKPKFESIENIDKIALPSVIATDKMTDEEKAEAERVKRRLEALEKQQKEQEAREKEEEAKAKEREEKEKQKAVASKPPGVLGQRARANTFPGGQSTSSGASRGVPVVAVNRARSMFEQPQQQVVESSQPRPQVASVGKRWAPPPKPVEQEVKPKASTASKWQPKAAVATTPEAKPEVEEVAAKPAPPPIIEARAVTAYNDPDAPKAVPLNVGDCMIVKSKGSHFCTVELPDGRSGMVPSKHLEFTTKPAVPVQAS